MPAISIGGISESAEHIAARAAQAAAGFEALGVAPGEVVALCLRNDFAFLEASFGAGQIGAYVTPLNWHASAEEARYLLNDSGAKILVVHTDLLAGIKSGIPDGITVLAVATPKAIREAYKLPAPPAPPEGEDWEAWLAAHPPRSAPPRIAPGAMIYTSGTTGKPKGVRRAPPSENPGPGLQGMFVALTGMTDHLTAPQDVTALIAGPLYHSTPNGWMGILFPLGVNLVIEPKFDPEILLRHIEQYRVTHLLAVPTMFVRMLRLPEETRKRYDLSSLKFVMHGAAPCAPQLKRAMIEWFGPVIHEHYGGTEIGAVTICDSHEWLAHPGTVGRAFAGAEVMVIGQDGAELKTGIAGNIYARNIDFPDFTYHSDPAKRAKAELGGLISLGDTGYLDHEGFLYLNGRSSDMVISGGVNIYPVEIEAELMKMPGVADCAIFGIPDEEFGEALCAFVQPLAGYDLAPETMRAFLRERVSGYKVPRRFELAVELPREDSGKIFKRKLRDPFWAGTGRAI